MKGFIEEHWKPYLPRKNVKPSTRAAYQSMLDRLVLPVIGDLRLTDVAPIHIEQFLRDKRMQKLSAKSVRNGLV